MFDLIIIGAGPAGIAASVYAARKKTNLLVISKDIGGQAAWSGDIENYIGYQFITGSELVGKFEEHMREYGIELKEKEEVLQLRRRDEGVWVKTDRGAYEAKTAVIASGKRSRELGVPGEVEFKNRGVTYCATCDGPLFSEKDVAVIGGGNSALDAALQLIQIARHIYLINITSALGGDAIMREKVSESKKVSILNSTQVTAVLGDRMVSGIKIRRQEKEETLPIQGVFVEIGLIPNSEFAKELEKNELGEFKVNCRSETNIPGIFAAGDVTEVPEKQIIIAAGEGAKAALSAFRYLAQHR
ncbi:FAD-dependent oxidoreductase [bacterium]|nr:FAD-dependent oxidoreductase [bacterium]